MQLAFVEEAFRTLKGDLSLRPIYHHKPQRIEAHLFVAFLAFCHSRGSPLFVAGSTGTVPLTTFRGPDERAHSHQPAGDLPRHDAVPARAGGLQSS
jgi:hypothetical protein